MPEMLKLLPTCQREGPKQRLERLPFLWTGSV